MDPALANAIAGQDPVEIAGSWHRHLPARYLPTAMEGRQGNSRWGRDPGFPILYLGRPVDSVVVEAYRRLVDPVVEDNPDILENLAPRMLVTADVTVNEILDLRSATARVDVGLTLTQLRSATTDRDSYEACREVAAAARQQGFHGLVVPAATQLGDTLALFSDRLAPAEVPVVSGEVLWDRLPADPRGRRSHLRIVPRA